MTSQETNLRTERVRAWFLRWPSVFPGTERTGTERSGSETPPYSTERTKGQSTARTVAGRAMRKGELKLS